MAEHEDAMNDGATSDDAVDVGALLAGRYRVVEPIGTGGMARVFLAHDEALGRRVAVKVLRADIADEATADRAGIETRLLASLNHPGLVTLFDAHLSHEPRFLVMEHVVGPTLADRIADGPLDIRELAALGAQLADALHVVHDAGIVHRDVKPSNILLARSSTPGVPMRAKLADFGIAHLLDSDRVTSPSLIVGTAAFIAPELLHGADPAPPSDIYALGLVLLEAASGERAFAGTEGNRGQLLARLSRDPEIPGGLDQHWRDLLCEMTAREPCDRPTAHEVMARIPSDGLRSTLSSTVDGRPESERRAAQADLATAAWPVTPPPAVSAPVTASRATAAGRNDTNPTLVSPSLAAAAASAPDRVIANRRQRRRRRRVALVTGVATAVVAVVVAASVVLAQPQTASTTTPVDPPVVQTPLVEPADAPDVAETDVSPAGDESADDAVEAEETVAVDAPIAPAEPVIEPVTEPVGVPVEPGPAEVPGAGGNGNGNGPGANSGSGPGSNSGNGNGNGNGKPGGKPGDGN
ncbi:serine/threonine-protein kinase [Microbacterium thalli]|uniref:serine/threonine-protein kinase n=1 Tax=Microbacterium thalli TaxID=3027921 RepID=UPI002365FD43|nr:serine/threonine-protein kinase [Microbacterium thalli]MDD7929241.1 protein kinase [Microbacterium thalli]